VSLPANCCRSLDPVVPSTIAWWPGESVASVSKEIQGVQGCGPAPPRFRLRSFQREHSASASASAAEGRCLSQPQRKTCKRSHLTYYYIRAFSNAGLCPKLACRWLVSAQHVFSTMRGLEKTDCRQNVEFLLGLYLTPSPIWALTGAGERKDRIFRPPLRELPHEKQYVPDCGGLVT
jgi:hypothetical protein